MSSSITRRSFLQASAATAIGLAAIGGGRAQEAERQAPVGELPPLPVQLVDVNVNLSRWPLRRVRFDETEELVAKLRRQGVAQAWAGSFDALLHKDLAESNAILVDECLRRGARMMVPFGTINPKMPDWEEEFRRCAEQHRMPGIRLFPNYHGYKLDDPEFARLLRMASNRRMVVQIAVKMEDERMMHPLLRVEAVDTAPLVDLMRDYSGLRVVLMNALGVLRGEALVKLLGAGEVYVEISMLEGVGGIERLLEQTPVSRVLFGSYAPLFYFESALLKLRESTLDEDQLNSICGANARRLLS